MTALYAYPDHEIIEQLIPGISQKHLDLREGIATVAAHDGLIPVGIDPRDGGKVMWADVGDYPFREWQFLYTIDHLAKNNLIRDAFTTSLDVLLDPGITERGIKPQGMIQHVSRCGSTLLAKGLARLEENVVINQGGPLQHGLWAVLSNNWTRPVEANEANLTLFRQLTLAMARRRAPNQTTCFVNFISWNTLYTDFIARAFPGVPQVFLYRNPAEVIASVRKNTTAALVAKGTNKGIFLAGPDQDVDDVTYLARCYAHYFEKVLAAEHPPVLVNYTNISAATAPQIYKYGLGYAPEASKLDRILEQFSLYSKDDSNTTAFKSDSEEKRQALNPAETAVVDKACMGLLSELDQSSNNLFQTTRPAVMRQAKF